MTDYDPRMVALYDLDNPDGPDHDFYRRLVANRGARSVLDLGCGTGMLTVSLTSPERRVVGVDPSASMLSVARGRDGTAGVEWVHGDITDAPAGPFDVVLMTGNVAQHIPDGEWASTLDGIRRRVVAGATLAFETRNPSFREWERWAAEPASTRTTPGGELTQWMELAVAADRVVRVRAHTLFHDLGETVTEELILTFRDRQDAEMTLRDAGFETVSVLGHWSGAACSDDARLLIFVARAVCDAPDTLG